MVLTGRIKNFRQWDAIGKGSLGGTHNGGAQDKINKF